MTDTHILCRFIGSLQRMLHINHDAVLSSEFGDYWTSDIMYDQGCGWHAHMIGTYIQIRSSAPISYETPNTSETALASKGEPSTLLAEPRDMPHSHSQPLLASLLVPGVRGHPCPCRALPRRLCLESGLSSGSARA